LYCPELLTDQGLRACQRARLAPHHVCRFDHAKPLPHLKMKERTSANTSSLPREASRDVFEHKLRPITASV
jgi:hypothetical protein